MAASSWTMVIQWNHAPDGAIETVLLVNAYELGGNAFSYTVGQDIHIVPWSRLHDVRLTPSP
jgi:hypothetical protein